MKRRAFVTGLGAVLAVPGAGGAQPPPGTTARVGYLSVGSAPGQTAPLLAAGLHERGWIEGRNLTIEWRFAESAEQLHASAAALGRLNLDVLVVPSFGVATVARVEARGTPIVITASGVDLVRTGLVTSLARPGGNITGSQVLQTEMFGKRLQLLKEVVPHLARVGRLGETVTLGGEDFVHAEQERAREEARAAARSLDLTLHFYVATRAEDVPALFVDMIKNGEQGVVVVGSPFMSARRQQIIGLMARHRIAAMYGSKSYVVSGGLISYGWDDSVLVSRAVAYVDKILKGAKAGDLPIEQPTKFELVINFKTAKALGLTIPQSLLLRADQVIE